MERNVFLKKVDYLKVEKVNSPREMHLPIMISLILLHFRLILF